MPTPNSRPRVRSVLAMAPKAVPVVTTSATAVALKAMKVVTTSVTTMAPKAMKVVKTSATTTAPKAMKAMTAMKAAKQVNRRAAKARVADKTAVAVSATLGGYTTTSLSRLEPYLLAFSIIKYLFQILSDGGGSPYAGDHGGYQTPRKRPAGAGELARGTKKRPSAADGANDGTDGDPDDPTPTRQRERQAGESVTLENMTKRERTKYDDAMMMSENNQQLSLMVCNLRQNHTNHWKNYIQGTPNKELQQEWAAINQIGYGNQKVVNLSLTSVFFYQTNSQMNT